MSDIIIRSSSELIPLPRCRAGEVNIRPAALADLPFIDSLQKMHTKMVGWMPTATLEGKIKAGHVLIAEEGLSADCADDADLKAKQMAPVLSAQSAKSAVPSSLGYCIATDRYFKHDDVGIIYQLNVVPGKQRGLIGASLLKAQFERSAWGCKLYCCWCAQDIAANYFWEAMGFVPLAFRAGSRGKDRVHIFWQRRIRVGDEATPWWFPSQTSSGAIREDRLVLPIPPGVRWSDEMPRILPALSAVEGPGERDESRGMRAEEQSARSDQKRLPGTRARKAKAEQVCKPSYGLGGSKLHFAVAAPAPAVKEKPPREKRKAVKNDPRMVAAARELRDRWLEEVNAGRYLPMSAAKYEVGRMVESSMDHGASLPALPGCMAA